MVSIKYIARKCNVSVATVSKALNNAPDISKQTKAKVIKLAEELGYVANHNARALRTSKTHNIGILYDNSERLFTHEFFSNVLESFKKEVEKNGYDITFINKRLLNRNISYTKHCEFRGFDGVVIITANFENKEIIELVKSDIPVVTIDHVYNDCSSVISDNTSGLSELLEYAIQMGHKKIAYIHGENTWVSKDRLTGFYATMAKYKLNIPDEYLIEGEYRNPELANNKTKELLSLKNPPTCILYPDDYSTILAIQTIRESGQSVSYMGYDGIDISNVMNITTYEQDRAALGKLAARKLIDRIENPNSIIEHTVVSGKVRIGNSVTKPSVLK